MKLEQWFALISVYFVMMMPVVVGQSVSPPIDGTYFNSGGTIYRSFTGSDQKKYVAKPEDFGDSGVTNTQPFDDFSKKKPAPSMLNKLGGLKALQNKECAEKDGGLFKKLTDKEPAWGKPDLKCVEKKFDGCVDEPPKKDQDPKKECNDKKEDYELKLADLTLLCDALDHAEQFNRPESCGAVEEVKKDGAGTGKYDLSTSTPWGSKNCGYNKACDEKWQGDCIKTILGSGTTKEVKESKEDTLRKKCHETLDEAKKTVELAQKTKEQAITFLEQTEKVFSAAGEVLTKLENKKDDSYLGATKTGFNSLYLANVDLGEKNKNGANSLKKHLDKFDKEENSAKSAKEWAELVNKKVQEALEAAEEVKKELDKVKTAVETHITAPPAGADAAHKNADKSAQTEINKNIDEAGKALDEAKKIAETNSESVKSKSEETKKSYDESVKKAKETNTKINQFNTCGAETCKIQNAVIEGNAELAKDVKINDKDFSLPESEKDLPAGECNSCMVHRVAKNDKTCSQLIRPGYVCENKDGKTPTEPCLFSACTDKEMKDAPPKETAEQEADRERAEANLKQLENEQAEKIAAEQKKKADAEARMKEAELRGDHREAARAREDLNQANNELGRLQGQGPQQGSDNSLWQGVLPAIIAGLFGMAGGAAGASLAGGDEPQQQPQPQQPIGGDQPTGPGIVPVGIPTGPAPGQPTNESTNSTNTSESRLQEDAYLNSVAADMQQARIQAEQNIANTRIRMANSDEIGGIDENGVLHDSTTASSQPLPQLVYGMDDVGVTPKNSIHVINNDRIMFSMKDGNTGIKNTRTSLGITGAGTTAMQNSHHALLLVSAPERAMMFLPGSHVYAGTNTLKRGTYTTNTGMVSLKEGVVITSSPACSKAVSDKTLYMPTGTTVETSFDKLAAPIAQHSVDISTTRTKQVLTSKGCADAVLYAKGSAFPMHFRTTAKGSRLLLYQPDPELDKDHYIIDEEDYQYEIDIAGNVHAETKLLQSGSRMPIEFSNKAKAMLYGQR